MDIQGIFGVVVVSNHERAVEWYARLLGREPDDRPMDGLTLWRAGPAGLQLWTDEEKAGASEATIVVANMARERLRLNQAGLNLEADQQGDFGVIAQLSDPDGNRLTLAEPPR